MCFSIPSLVNIIVITPLKNVALIYKLIILFRSIIYLFIYFGYMSKYTTVGLYGNVKAVSETVRYFPNWLCDIILTIIWRRFISLFWLLFAFICLLVSSHSIVIKLQLSFWLKIVIHFDNIESIIIKDKEAISLKEREHYKAKVERWI